MSADILRQCFDGVAVKRLSAVEADPSRSHQHEFNGVNRLRKILGNAEPRKFQTMFVWLGDEQEGITEEGFLTWYDARRDHPTRTEYRLYYSANAVMEIAKEHDAVFIAARPNDTIMVIVTPANSTIEQQVAWLFGLSENLNMQFSVRSIGEISESASEFATRYILEELGLEIEEPEVAHFDLLLEKFDKKFPTTREFSEFTRESLPDITPRDDPDAALLAWMEREESLFRRLERHILEERLQKGFVEGEEIDVDGFIKFSLSVQNRRKSRVGLAFENHLEAIFLAHNLRYDRGKKTENKAKPDFIFPSISDYHNLDFSADKLTMLGVKSTCKDRWRQVLSEAARIEHKHLITLEPSISEHQTAEMKNVNLQLVLPKSLHSTFKLTQQDWLITLSDFVDLAKDRQTQANEFG